MHIDKDILKQFHAGTLDSKELIEVLEHINKCSFCAEQLMEIEENDLIKAPSYIKESINKRVQMPDMRLNNRIKETSKRMELFLYSLKTTAAVVGALMLLISISYINTSNVLNEKTIDFPSVSISSQLYEKSNEVVHIVNYFSSRIINGGKN